MKIGKYYNWEDDRILTEDDGCALSAWSENSEVLFTVHPKGFLIFMPPSEIDARDEYKGKDLYAPKRPSEFRERRFKHTTILAQEALGNKVSPRLLDIGCGQGHIAAAIHDSVPEAEVSALDQSVTAIQYAVDEFPNIDFIVCDAYKLPYAKHYFDLVVCNNIWEHVPDPLSLLSEIRKVLRPGGHLIVSTPSRFRTANLIRVLMGKSVQFSSEYHVTEYTVGQVVEQMSFMDFTVLEITTEPIRYTNRVSIKQHVLYFFVFDIIEPILGFFLKLIGSHHRLESTVFYLAVNAQSAN